MSRKTPEINTLNDIRKILNELPGPDDQAAKMAAAREPQLTKPEGSLGRLEELSKWLCTWQGGHPPRMKRPRCVVFAGNHGVASLGVSAFPSEVTFQMVANFRSGGAAINQLCKTFDIDLEVCEMALDVPTADFTKGPAMGDEECAEAMAFGMDMVKDKTDVLCLGEMGIGNTTPAAAICHALFGGSAALWTGPGTGVEGEALGRKTAVVADSVLLHKTDMTDAIEVLRYLGGRELAAIAGAVIGARLKGVPVLLDGYVSTAAAAPLQAFMPGALDHCQVAHNSVEPGHIKLAESIGKRPLLEMDMRLGEASGAALAVGLLRAAVSCHTGMATCAEAGVSGKSDHE